jgi:hypothetical protein
MTLASADHHEAAVIELDAIAAPPEPAKDATVMDREGHVVKLGDNGWTRVPPPAHLQETPPMCNDGAWAEWADAYLHMKDYAGATFGVCYMLASDEGAGNIDPCAKGWSSS